MHPSAHYDREPLAQKKSLLRSHTGARVCLWVKAEGGLDIVDNLTVWLPFVANHALTLRGRQGAVKGYSDVGGTLGNWKLLGLDL
jgi:hypothetical protein